MMITKEQATEMIILLSKEFKVRRPKLEIYARGTGGHYRTRTQTIRMSRKGLEDWAVLHEFAHHLDALTNKPRVMRTPSLVRYSAGVLGYTRTRETFHDVPFRACLIRIAVAWYGDAKLYPWSKEYRSIRKWWNSKLSTCQDSAPALDSSALQEGIQ